MEFILEASGLTCPRQHLQHLQLRQRPVQRLLLQLLWRKLSPRPLPSALLAETMKSMLGGKGATGQLLRFHARLSLTLTLHLSSCESGRQSEQ